MGKEPLKATVTFERRGDGGLRVYSNDIPGLILSGRDAGEVLGDAGRVVGMFMGIASPRGLFDQLTPDQQRSALAYDGPQNIGDADGPFRDEDKHGQG